MNRNRISRLYDQFSALEPPAAVTHPSGVVTATAMGSMVLVPVVAQQATWQAQVYSVARERALRDLAPPAHHRRYFSVWN